MRRELLQRLEILKQSKVHVFLQTKNCLTHPAILLELFTAMQYNIPICPVIVLGEGYSFAAAIKHLSKSMPESKRLYPHMMRCVERTLQVY
jgi:hypothetical protein